MRITYAPRGILQIDDARIVYRNFAGEGSKFNREGDRNFAVVIDNKRHADELVERGWNIRVKPPREDGDEPFMYLPVKIKFNDRGPNVYLKTGSRVNRLDEETIGCIDNLDILGVNLDIRPYDWDVNGKSGRTAYLQSIEVVQQVDRFGSAYDEVEPY